MRYSTYHFWIALVLGAFAIRPAPAAHAASGDILREQGCADCHAIEAPAPEQRTLAAYASRKGPDLFYAASKYRPEWLERWLAHPTPIRPAGLHPAERTRTAADGDHVVAGDLPAHPPVAPAKLGAVLGALAKLDWGHERVAGGPPAHVAIPRTLAELNFSKFKGCGSCHRTSASEPPLSGPDLIDAYARLEPAFLASVIAMPQSWDPVAPMPDYHLEPPEVGKLTEYLRLLSEENHDSNAH